MISVCMATYNGEKYIKRQIESILCQLSEQDELIISDDGSTDATIKLVESFQDERIKLFHNNQHDYTKNFENALRNASGDYIFLSDQDDIWVDKRIECTMPYFDTYDFIHCNAKIIDENGTVLVKSRNQECNVKNGFFRNYVKTYYLGCCMSFNRKVLQSVLPFPPNSKLCKHDAWIALVSELLFKTCVIDDCLILYRRHGANVSAGALKRTNTVRGMVAIRMYLILNILKRSVQWGRKS